MRFPLRPTLFTLALSLTLVSAAMAGPKSDSFWQVDDIRAGMKGNGRTVIKGTKIESFGA